ACIPGRPGARGQVARPEAISYKSKKAAEYSAAFYLVPADLRRHHGGQPETYSAGLSWPSSECGGSTSTVTGASSKGLANWRAASRSAASMASFSLRAM